MFEQILDPYNYPFWVLIASIIIVVFGLILRPFLTHVKFAYPNALLEAIGNPFIEEKNLNHLVNSKDVSGFKESVNALKDYNIEGENIYDVQRSLDNNFIQTIKMIEKNSPRLMKDFYNIYFEKFDIHIIKNILNSKLKEKSIEDIEIAEVNLDTTKLLLQKLKDAEKKDIPEILRLYGFNNEIIDIVSEEKIDFFALNNYIDKYIINKFKQVKVPYNCEETKQKFINIMIDIINIKNVLRAKQLGYDNELCKKLFLGEGQEIATWKYNEMTNVDHVSQVISSIDGTSYFSVLKDNIENYNKENSIQVLEIALDRQFIKLIKDLSLKNFVSIGPSFRFLVSKEYEIQNLKIIAKGVGENLSSDIIKKFFVTEARS